jgi:hypothetical protein
MKEVAKMPLVILILRFMWRYRGLMALGVLIILGHIWLNDAIRAWDNWHKPVEYCDQAHTLVYVPAEECGGMSSCDRNAFGGLNGKPIPCPTP